MVHIFVRTKYKIDVVNVNLCYRSDIMFDQCNEFIIKHIIDYMTHLSEIITFACVSSSLRNIVKLSNVVWDDFVLIESDLMLFKKFHVPRWVSNGIKHVTLDHRVLQERDYLDGLLLLPNIQTCHIFTIDPNEIIKWINCLPINIKIISCYCYPESTNFEPLRNFVKKSNQLRDVNLTLRISPEGEMSYIKFVREMGQKKIKNLQLSFVNNLKIGDLGSLPKTVEILHSYPYEFINKFSCLKSLTLVGNFSTNLISDLVFLEELRVSDGCIFEGKPCRNVCNLEIPTGHQLDSTFMKNKDNLTSVRCFPNLVKLTIFSERGHFVPDITHDMIEILPPLPKLTLLKFTNATVIIPSVIEMICTKYPLIMKIIYGEKFILV